MQEEQDISQATQGAADAEAPKGGEAQATPGQETRKAAPARKNSAVDALDALDEKEYSDEEFESMMSLYDGTLRNIEEGEIVRGKVLAIDDNDVVVDIGFKSEGTIPLSEFGNPPAVAVGDEVDRAQV